MSKENKANKAPMWGLTMIIAFSMLAFYTGKQSEYQEAYHSFWRSTCETYQRTKGDEYEYITKRIKKGTCEAVYRYSKGNYDTFARQCWNDHIQLLDCLEKQNIFFKYLNVR